jgi:Family of unknown function (DUF5681)
MSSPDDEYRVGRGRPPLKTRWKKGQSGNPRHQKAKRAESALEMIDRLLLEPVSVTLNGESQKIPAIRAIVLRLQQLAASGNTRAYRVIQKYEVFVGQNTEKKFELTFIDNDYSLAFSVRPGGRDDE